MLFKPVQALWMTLHSVWHSFIIRTNGEIMKAIWQQPKEEKQTTKIRQVTVLPALYAIKHKLRHLDSVMTCSNYSSFWLSFWSVLTHLIKMTQYHWTCGLFQQVGRNINLSVRVAVLLCFGFEINQDTNTSILLTFLQHYAVNTSLNYGKILYHNTFSSVRFSWICYL